MSGTKTSFSHFKFQFLSVLNAKSCFWFAAQRVRDGLIYPVIMFPSFSRGPRIWTDGWGVVLTTASFRGKSRTQASFSQLRLSGFQQSLARKLRCHNFNLQFFREVSHESFIFTSWSYDSIAARLRQGCGNEFLQLFLVFGAFHFRLENSLSKSFTTVLFSVLARRSFCLANFSFCNSLLENRIGSGHETVALLLFINIYCVRSCSSIVFCNSLGANRIGMVAPKLRRWVFDDVYHLGAFHFSCRILFRKGFKIVLFVAWNHL